MSHFYRLYTVNDFTGNQCGIGVAKSVGPDGPWAGLQPEWRRAMDEVALDLPWPHCRMFRASLAPPECKQLHYLFNIQPGIELPDIWAWGELGMISERAKRVLESCDDFEHEYIETEIQDTNRQKINKETYYLLNVRRILKIDESGPYGAIENKFEMFCPMGKENKFLPVVQRTPELKEKLSQLPLWRQDGLWDVVYMSENVVQALKNAGVTGIDPYTSYDGKPCEALARFE